MPKTKIKYWRTKEFKKKHLDQVEIKNLIDILYLLHPTSNYMYNDNDIKQDKVNFTSFLICTHSVFLFEKHSEDLLCEEEEVKASEHHRRLGHVEMHHWVKTKGLPCRAEDGVSLS